MNSPVVLPSAIPPAHPFLQKTAEGLARLFAKSFTVDESQTERLDARLKILAVVSMVIMVSILHRSAALILVAVCGVFAAAYSRLSPKTFFLRLSLAPLFTWVMVLPSTIEYGALRPILIPLGFGFAVSKPAVYAGAILVLRVGVSITWVMVLVGTTRSDTLLQGLRELGIGPSIMQALVITLRYLDHLVEQVGETHMALKSRIVRRLSTGESQHAVSSMAGAFLLKSLRQSRDIHQAMVSRGFTGNAVWKKGVRWRTKGTLLLAAWCLALVCIGWWGQ